MNSRPRYHVNYVLAFDSKIVYDVTVSSHNMEGCNCNVMVILSYIIILSWISRLTILISSYHLSVKCQYRSFLPFHPCPGNPSIQLRPIHHSPSRSAHHEPYQWGKDSGSGSQCAQVDGLKASSLQTIQASTEAVEGNGARFSSSGCTISIS